MNAVKESNRLPTLARVALAVALVLALINLNLIPTTHAASIQVSTTGADTGNRISAPSVTITVTTDEDELDIDGDCSLREAIQAANTNATVDVCPAGSSINPDTIIVPAGTYTLTLTGALEDNNATGDLDILGDVTIGGAGATSTTINGDRIDRVLDIPTGGLAVTIDDLTITNGRTGGQGGGIRNEGTLTLNNVVITDNTTSASDGGGIHNDGGTLTLNDCTISDNAASPATGEGGGINNHGGAAATLNRCTISGNSATDGGGIHNYGGSGINRLELNNSTVSGNWATGHGGGIYTRAGIGLHELALLNCTITDNIADSNDNNSGDGGGVYNDGGSTDVRNTIVAGNYDLSNVTSHPDWSMNLRSEGYTLVGDTTGTILNQAVPSTDILNADPALGTLADNGGDTQTHALSGSSPALDAVPTAQCTLPTDQRGVTRPQRSVCDMGAYERENEAPGAVGDTVYTDIDTPIVISVLANDTDSEEDALSVTGVGSPIIGTASIASSTTVAYTPTLGFQGIDVFTYTVSDSYGSTDTATVTVIVGDKFVYLPLVLQSY